MSLGQACLDIDDDRVVGVDQVVVRIGSLQFSAQYQQSPVPRKGNLIRLKWFKYYDTAPERGRGVHKFDGHRQSV